MYLITLFSAHKNLKLAIMHGGLMGIYEAVDCGIPILGIPVFFDQHKNIENLVSREVALRLDIDKITKANFLESIRRLLDDKRFVKCDISETKFDNHN